MTTSRARAAFLFLLLALVLSTTGCRGGSGSRAGFGSHAEHGVHLPWFSSSHKPDATKSAAALHSLAPDLAAQHRLDEDPVNEVWVAPLAEPIQVTRPFQPPPTPYAAGHRGVDLAGSPGQQVRTAGAGTVTWAGVLAGRGVVVVSHGKLRTTYEPVEPLVVEGNPVQPGEPIATLQPGHPGCPVAACLHWGLLRGSDYLDPILLIEHSVRLLPLGGG
jgi:murein DD-endopeptidase MepM/ murein hydrolase activator NlpD